MAVLTPEPVASIPSYRKELKKVLSPELLKPDLSNLWWFPVHFAILATCLYALHSYFSWYTAPLLAVIMGHSFGCMGFLAHDILHGGAVKNTRLRDFLAAVGFSPFAIGPHLWKRWHNAEHHNHTNVEGEDPDHLFTIEEYQNNPVLRFLYRIHPLLRNLVIFGSFTFRMSQQNLRMYFRYMADRGTAGRNKLIMTLQLVAPLAFWIGIPLALGTKVLAMGYLIPILIGNAMVIGYIATNHFLNPLADERDVLGTSLSVTLPKPFRFLDPWHQYFGAHVAHHLFPQAPARNVRAIDQKAKELWPDRFHEMPIHTALAMLWKTPWVYEDKVNLVDPQRNIRMKTLGHGLRWRKGKDN